MLQGPVLAGEIAHYDDELEFAKEKENGIM